MFRKKCFIFLLVVLNLNAQVDQSVDSTRQKHNLTPFIAPAALITIGIYGINNEPFKSYDLSVNNRLGNGTQQTGIDDFLFLSPGVAVYAMEFIGVSPKNNLIDRSIQLATSIGFTVGVTRTMKNSFQRRRPDGRSLSSFPSGHTAFAFVVAEFAHQELGHLSPWYSIGAYSIAATTGFLRVYNHKHWVTDVIAGAGVGILLTKLVYYVYPKLKNHIFKPANHKESVHLSFSPTLIENKMGVGLYVTF